MTSGEVVSLDSRRALTVGGSEAAAACGLDPYRSRVMLWCEKTGRVQREQTEAMRWGTLLEFVVLAEMRNRGYDVSPFSREGFQDAERPWLVGHPDALTELDGWPAVLEIKTASSWAGHDWREEAKAPLAYILQCQQYMHLTGYSFALLACLVGGQRLELRRVNRDDNAIALMLGLEAGFVEHVERDDPPPPDGSDSAKDALAAMYPESAAGEVVRLTGDEWRDYRTLRARREQRDTIDRQISELEQRLKARMGNAATAISPHDEIVARWTTYDRTSIDTTALRRAVPSIAAEYETTKRLRRFTLE